MAITLFAIKSSSVAKVRMWHGSADGGANDGFPLEVDHLPEKVHAPTVQQRENGNLQLRLRIAPVALGPRCFGGPKRRTIAPTTREAGNAS
jgi:hypothetical protein